jgi:hypothetical protein
MQGSALKPARWHCPGPAKEKATIGIPHSKNGVLAARRSQAGPLAGRVPTDCRSRRPPIEQADGTHLNKSLIPIRSCPRYIADRNRRAYRGGRGACGQPGRIRLGRFAYTPLIPPLIEAAWFRPSQGGLSRRGQSGGISGWRLGRVPLAARFPAASLLRTMMLLAAPHFCVRGPCRSPGSSHGASRRALAGGVIMVLAAPTVLPHIDPTARAGGS